MDLSQISFIIILVVAIILFIKEWISIDLTALLIILSLSVLKILDVKEAFSGFASEPAIIVAAVFVLSRGLSATGLTDSIGRAVGRLAGKSETRANIVVMSTVAALSAFTHHLMVTAMMLPIVMKICHDSKIPSSRLLIPMATAASLGTTLTIIGAPAFLLANSILKRSGDAGLSLFSVAPVGGALIVVSFIFILLMRWILPRRSGQSTDSQFKVDGIYTELVIPPESKWIGSTIEELTEATKTRFQILNRLRKTTDDSNQPEVEQLREGDLILVRTSADELVSIEERLGLALRAVRDYGQEITDESFSLSKEIHNVVQAVVAPNSTFIGKTVEELNFFSRFGVIVVGIWRRDGWLYSQISHVSLREGDLLVLWGPAERIDRLSRRRDFLLLVPLFARVKRRIKAGVAASIMLLSILAAATEILPPHVAFLLGAVAMVLSGCIDMKEAYGSIETKIYVLIAGVIPLGIAMEKTGVVDLLVQNITGFMTAWSPFAVVLMMFTVAALLTQILSDAATTVLLAPVALSLAKGLDISPTAAVVATTVGAVASFLTPIGHHGNLLILSPGDYRFSDFLKIGLPLTVLIAYVTVQMCLYVWPS